MNANGDPLTPGVIFDLDGTLADTLDDITDSINEVFSQINHAFVARERIRLLIGESLPNLLRQASGINDPDVLADFVGRYRHAYGKRMLNKTRLYPGVEPMLDVLAESRVPMCVLSNKPHEYTAPICNALLARWPFVRFRGSHQDDGRKPDPAVALELVMEMQRPPPFVYFVGDSSTDILTARNAGMIPVAVTWGYRDRDDLEVACPAHYVDQPERLVELLQNHPGAEHKHTRHLPPSA
ncbi:MAG: HAD family hydrolase [Phycisphaerales bacterium]|nr:MAG: HAD family hydrolase [Phycisphaerales bacterium]